MKVHPFNLIKITGNDKHNKDVDETIQQLQHQADIKIAERRHQEILRENKEANKIAKRALIMSGIAIFVSIVAIVASVLIGIYT